MGGGRLALRVAATWALARAGFSDTELGAGVQGRVLGVADMDGDGTLDVVTASADRFTVVYNTAEGFIATDSGADGNVAAVAALALADLDGDGAADVLLAAGTSVQIWQFDGDMTAPLNLRWETSGNSAAAGCLDVFDFTGDGLADFFAGRPEENLLSSYRRLGEDFVEGVVDNDAGGVAALVHADVNGDGDVDAFAAYGALNAVAYLKNDGAGNEASFTRLRSLVRSLRTHDLRALAGLFERHHRFSTLWRVLKKNHTLLNIVFVRRPRPTTATASTRTRTRTTAGPGRGRHPARARFQARRRAPLLRRRRRVGRLVGVSVE